MSVKKYRIKLDACVSCGDCVEVCPLSAISADPYVINPELCDACKDCVKECPTDAIEKYDYEPPEPVIGRPVATQFRVIGGAVATHHARR